MQHALAPWPRREAPLLEINCGKGLFLPFLWQCGFDVKATEANQELRAKALTRKVPALEVVTAHSDSLPFDDDSFDWAILHLFPMENAEIATHLYEALRICARGLMISFWNKNSLPAAVWRCGHKKDFPFFAFSWKNLWRQLRAMNAGRLCGMTTLCGPVGSWNKNCRAAAVNSWITSLPIGAWGIIRLDLAPLYPLTSLPLRIKNVIRNPEPAMEYAHEKRTLKPLKSEQEKL